jgi:pimeloyl-ACP methyl ester carboxylesterase
MLAVTLAASLGCSGEDRARAIDETGFGEASSGNAQELAQDEDGRLRGSPCPIDIPAGRTARCGTLTVPLDYGAPEATQLDLSVMVFEGEAAGDPAIYLEGGPGGAGSSTIEAMFPIFEPLLVDRDVVILDQRGTGRSEPLLHCAGMDRAFRSELSDAEQRGNLTAELRSCAADFREQGIEPQHFSSHANAADVERLRQALGYDQWHVLGVSYGTRLALDVMRYFPQGVASVVLDSTVPSDVDLLAGVPRSMNATFQRIFERCASQAACDDAYPNLAATFSSMVASLTQSPVELQLSDDVTYLLDGRRAVELFGTLSYAAENIVYIPELIRQLSNRQLGTIREIVELLHAPGGGVPPVAIGMYLSIVCSEYAAFSSAADVQVAIALLEPELQPGFSADEIFDFCEAWNVPSAPASEREPVESDIPTLVLAGSYDPVTPPEWGERVMTGLSNGVFEQMESSGHAVFATSCGTRMIREFWNDPERYRGGACSTLDIDLVYQVLPNQQQPSTASLQFASLRAGQLVPPWRGRGNPPLPR